MMAVSQAREDVWVKTFCHGCLSATCGLMVHRVDGVVVGLKGDPDNPFNRGRLCAKAYANIMTLYDPYRPRQPLVRTNPEKGIGVDPRWKEVSWEEALDLAAKKLAEVRERNAADLCFVNGDTSHHQFSVGPILGSFGSPNMNTTSGYWCAAAAHTVPYATLGCFHHYVDTEYCNYLVLWGSNKGGVIQHQGTTVAWDVAAARKRGMKLVSIDPVQSNIGAKANEWIPIRPGTDLALALAWLNVLLNEAGIYDVEHLKAYTNGPYLIQPDGHYFRDKSTNKPLMWDPIEATAKPYDADFKDVAIEGEYLLDGMICKPSFQVLKEHVKQYTPEWAAPITTISADIIRRLAREFGEAASIGSTIRIEDQILPLRPAGIHWYAGISQHVNGYVTGIALMQINTVVGNLLVPGGVVGEGPFMDYPYGRRTRWTGRDSTPQELDGIIVPSRFARAGGGVLPTGYPPAKVQAPRTHDAKELLPLTFIAGPLMEANCLHPERFNHKIPTPKTIFARHGSDLTCKANPQEVAQTFKDRFQISCEPFVDETAEFADIFFPAPVRLERCQFSSSIIGYAGGTRELRSYCINFSQPVVPTEARDVMDIWIDLAERIGILEEFNMITNISWDLQDAHKLDPTKKYTFAEIQDRLRKSVFGPEFTLEQAAKVGHVAWRKTVRERYPRVFMTPRAMIYYEHFIDAGKEVAEITKELGFEWDVEDYKPLPTWRPGPSLRETRPEYDLRAIPFRVPFLTHMWQTHNPWLEELGEVHPWAFKVILNAETAASHGVRDGDEIEVESVVGYKVRGRAKLTQCIHPEVVALSRHGGHWAAHPIAKGKGTHFNTLIPHNTDYIDPTYGGLEGCIRVRVAKTTNQ